MRYDRDCMVPWNIIRQCRWHWMVFAPTTHAQWCARWRGRPDLVIVDSSTSFALEVGLNPKRFNRIDRFQRVLEKVHRLPDPEWGQLAVEHGYFDQSHLIRDFLEFSGFSPADYLRRLKDLRDKGLHVKFNHLPVGK
jgi:hypothetical protein